MSFFSLGQWVGRTAATVALGGGLVFSSLTTAAHAMEIQDVTSPGGIKAWLVEEHGLPLIAMRFGFQGGAAQDPEGKEGVANLMSTLLDEGAGDMDARAFQERMEELAVKFSVDAGLDTFSGTFQTLTENRADAIKLLKAALTSPRFDADAVARMKASVASGLAFDAKDPGKVASRAWSEAAFAGHPYARPVSGTVDSLKAITRDDLEAFRTKVFARDTLRVVVVGDITPKELGAMLDEVFGDLAAKSGAQPVADVTFPESGITKVIDMDVPQSVAQFGHRAFAREDDDFIASFILNYIIGGGGFNSRLMEEVREKRGLAYSVYSYVAPYEHASVFRGGVATKNEEINRSIDVIRGVLTRMAKEGPSQVELDNAKKYLTGSYALRFDTSAKIAGQLFWVQMEGLGKEYITERNSLIEAVTLDDIKRVAKRLLKPDSLIVTIVGQPAKT
ncbi:MAG: pitrilysin family protein [Pseudomonadota bacterium]